jgi:hypothetical protein
LGFLDIALISSYCSHQVAFVLTNAGFASLAFKKKLSHR